MTLPVPKPEPIVVYDRQGADDFAALVRALAVHRAQQGPMTLVYAPSTATHHHALTPLAVPMAQAGGTAHPGVDIDVTGYGAGFVPPAYVSALPPVPERRTLAPLAFLVCGWSTLAAALGTAITGDLAALVVTVGALTGTAASVAVMYRRQL